MLKDITLGQFFPGESPMHKMDARIKLVVAILYLVAVLSAKTVYAIGAIVGITLAMVLISGISVRTILRGMKPLIFIMAFTAVFNIFFREGETLLLDLWVFEIYLEGILYAVMLVIRIVMMLTGTSLLLTYTTSPIVLTDALERVMRPLKLIRVPVHDFAMMMTIALRFIPTLVEEADKIISAQKARGADFESGSLLRRAKALLPVLIPLFVSAWRHAEELAVAMECRCYRGDVGRTTMKQMKLHVSDLIWLLAFCGVLVGILYLNRLGGFRI